MKTIFIEDEQALTSFCIKAAQKNRIAIDTEFMRVRTRYPQFALLQIFDGETVALVDPLKISDWKSVKAILINPAVTKYFHSGSEDLELFKHHLNVLPAPYIDTQVLAAFAGEGLSCGLANLLNKYLGIQLDKSETRTDWLARPLSDAQLDYAALDVFYLLDLADILWTKITDNKLKEFALDECQLLCKKHTRTVNLGDLYTGFSHVEELKPQQLAILQKLAVWRWQEADRQDIALNFIVHESSLLNVAKAMPRTSNELQILKLHPNELRQHGIKLLDIVNSTLSADQSSYPKPIKLLHHYPNYKQDLALLRDHIAALAETYNIPAQLIASKKQLNQLLKHRYEESSTKNESVHQVFSGWREEVCAESLRAAGFW